MTYNFSIPDLWFGFTALLGVVLGVLAWRPEKVQSIFTEQSMTVVPSGSQPTVERYFPVWRLVFLIGICLLTPSFATWLATTSPLAPNFASQATAWSVGLGLGAFWGTIALFSSGMRVAAPGPAYGPSGLALTATSLALIFFPNSQIAALLGVALGWCLVSIWGRGDSERLLVTTAFVVMLALVLVATTARDDLLSKGGSDPSRWTLLCLGLVSSTIVAWLIGERTISSTGSRYLALFLIPVAMVGIVVLTIMGSGPLTGRILAVLLLGVGTTIGLRAIVKSDTGEPLESPLSVPPLTAVALLAGAIVAHITLQGIGVAFWLLAAWATAGVLQDRKTNPQSSTLWMLLVVGVMLLQFRMLSIIGYANSKAIEWGDFYALFGLLVMGSIVLWCARVKPNPAARGLAVLAALCAPVAIILLLGARPAPAVILGGLAAILFSGRSNTLLAALFSLLSGLFVLQWLDTTLVFAALPRLTRVTLMAWAIGLSVLVWAGHRVMVNLSTYRSGQDRPTQPGVKP